MKFISFLKSHKKFTIITSVILVLLLTIIILLFTLFSLKKVDLEFKTETNVLASEEVQSEIKETILGYSTSVFFMNKDKIINQIERDFPYIKVVNIETKIPDSFVVHCAEREELYAIESNDKTYYLDEELKILKIEDGDFVKTETNAVLLEFVSPNTGNALDLGLLNAEAGQLLTLTGGKDDFSPLMESAQNVLESLLNAFEENERTISVVRGAYSKFQIQFKYQEIDGNKTWFVDLLISDKAGFVTDIVEAEKKLAEKIYAMNYEVGELATNDIGKLSTHKMMVFEDSDGNIKISLQEK